MYGTITDSLLTGLVNRPALVLPSAMAPLLTSIKAEDPEQQRKIDAALLSEHAEQRDGYYLDQGVAVIPVMGPTAHRSWWRTSYERLSRTHDSAQNDPDVKALVWVFDSPGGMVAGVFDFADELYQARGNKPAISLVSEMAASAAYLMASSVGEIIVPRTGEVGSVGVVMQHWDFSSALEDMGIGQTYIYAGDHKVDGNPYQPLPKDVQARFQDEIDHVYGMFVDAVSRYRGMQREAVIGTQAMTYIGEKAVNVGFADSVKSAREVIAAMKKEYGAGTGLWSMSHQTEGGNMATETQKPEEAGTETETANAETQAAEAAPETTAEQSAAEQQDEAALANTNAADPAKVVSMAQAAGLGQFAADWISGGLTLEQVKSNIAFAESVTDQCSAAGIDPAPFMATGGDASKLLNLAVTHAAASSGGEHIDNGVAAQAGDDKDAGWGKAFGSSGKQKF